MEEFAAYTGGREDIWYATNIQIYDYIEAYRNLKFSTDGTLVYNPTAMALYFWKEGKDYCIRPGENMDII